MNAKPLRVTIVGCGGVGRKRSRALGGAQLVACVDIIAARAEELAATVPGCQAFSDWREMLAKAACDIVIVATLHDSLAEITTAAVTSGRHVLVEKPAGRRSSELEPILPLAQERGALVRVGLNHRYHPALLKARELGLPEGDTSTLESDV